LRERTFKFACDIVVFCRELSAEPGVVRNIAWQLADAGTSVAANYEEAKAAYSRREFAYKNRRILNKARESRQETIRLRNEAEERVGIFTVGVRKLRMAQAATAVVIVVLCAALAQLARMAF
jgi:four helix bundle protein